MTDTEFVREIVQPVACEPRIRFYGAVAGPGETDHDFV
jgi:hypothetical protein